jgi:hypothetical protein
MSAKSQHPSHMNAPGSTAARNCLPQPEREALSWPRRRYCERACCCSASPVVVAVITPAKGRREPTDLLLCGHHYRASKSALEAAGATVLDLRGYPLFGKMWPELRQHR